MTLHPIIRSTLRDIAHQNVNDITKSITHHLVQYQVPQEHNTDGSSIGKQKDKSSFSLPVQPIIIEKMVSSWSFSVVLIALVSISVMDSVETFSMPPTTTTIASPSSTITLFAAKKKSSKKKASSTGGGFGGASMEPCPCGSSLTYASCCGKIHKDVNAYKSASAADVVKARYSAYAKKQVIISVSYPQSVFQRLMVHVLSLFSLWCSPTF
jgi:hypothetical protein